MNKIIKASLFASTLLLTAQGFAQSSLYVSAGANFLITPNTFVYIDGLQVKPSADFNIVGLNSVTRDATAPPPPPSSYIQRVYHFLQNTAPFSGDITFYYTDAELNGLAENTLNLSIYNGTAWTSYLPSSRDAANNVVTRTGLAAVALDELTLTSPAVTVPVTLMRFTAQSNACTALLQWTTASEQESKEFEVQHSTDGVAFTVVATLPAAGNSNTEKQYSYTASLSSQYNYFRLRMVDLDGRSKISTLLRVTSNCNGSSITAFPNPATKRITVNGLTGTNSLRLLNAAGQVVHTTTPNANASQTVYLSGMAAGNYVVQVVQGGKEIKIFNIVKH